MELFHSHSCLLPVFCLIANLNLLISHVNLIGFIYVIITIIIIIIINSTKGSTGHCLKAKEGKMS